MFTDFGDMLDGKFLVPSSNDVEGHTEGGLPYGAISGYLTQQQPAAIKRFYALPYELCEGEARRVEVLPDAAPRRCRRTSG